MSVGIFRIDLVIYIAPDERDINCISYFSMKTYVVCTTQHMFSWRNKKMKIYVVCTLPASVAQLAACLTGDQEVAGLILAGSAAFFHGDLIMKYFLWSLSPFH